MVCISIGDQIEPSLCCFDGTSASMSSVADAGSFQAAFSDMPSSMDHGRAASPMPKQLDFPVHQQSTHMLAQYGTAPHNADVASPQGMHAPARPAMPVHPGGLLQSSSILGYAIPHGFLRQDDPVQQLQQLQDEFEGPAERIRSSAYRAGSGDGPSGASADRAPTVRSSLQGSSGQKKKVPMQCQVSYNSNHPTSADGMFRLQWCCCLGHAGQVSSRCIPVASARRSCHVQSSQHCMCRALSSCAAFQ